MNRKAASRAIRDFCANPGVKARAAVAAVARRRLTRESLWIVAAHALNAIAGIASIRLFTQLAPQSTFGGANLLIGVLTLGMHTLIAPATQTQVRYQSFYADRGTGDAYTWLVIRLSLACAFAMVIGMCVVLLVWPAARAGAGASVVGLLAIWILVSTAKAVLLGRLNAERRQKQYALWVACEAVFLLLCTGGALALWPTVEGYIAGQTLALASSMILFGGPQMWRLARASTSERVLRGTAYKEMINYGMPFAGFALLGWLCNLSDRYVLAAYLGIAAVGQYTASFAIASRLPGLAAGLLTDILRPVLFELENRSDTANVDRLFIVWLAVLGAVSTMLIILLALFGNIVARILLAESYRVNAPEIMCWIAVGYGCTNLAQVIEIRVLALGASRALLWSKTAGAVANLAFAVYFISLHGVVGAAQANAAGQAIQLLTTVAILTSIRRRVVPAHP